MASSIEKFNYRRFWFPLTVYGLSQDSQNIKYTCIKYQKIQVRTRTYKQTNLHTQAETRAHVRILHITKALITKYYTYTSSIHSESIKQNSLLKRTSEKEDKKEVCVSKISDIFTTLLQRNSNSLENVINLLRCYHLILQSHHMKLQSGIKVTGTPAVYNHINNAVTQNRFNTVIFITVNITFINIKVATVLRNITGRKILVSCDFGVSPEFCFNGRFLLHTD